jgi:hypothetical protein
MLFLFLKFYKLYLVVKIIKFDSRQGSHQRKKETKKQKRTMLLEFRTDLNVDKRLPQILEISMRFISLVERGYGTTRANALHKRA